MLQPYLFSRTPQIYFGVGKFKELANIIRGMAKTTLFVTGSSSFIKTHHWNRLMDALKKENIAFFHTSVKGEPSPDWVDKVVSEHKTAKPDVVVAIGGGSALDSGKAISAMLLQNGSIRAYLEGVGTGAKHNGIKVPFIAVPTTSGTGSEASKNAVLSVVGNQGFKKSIRHENFIPDIAIVDPELTLTCPPEITAACGMDAFTQLLEPYVSSKPTPMTDALSLDAISYLRDSLVPSCEQGDKDIASRTGMSYAALISGITLANAGLGVVHGFASVIGGLFPAPHGVICGTLVSEATKINIRRLKSANDEKSRIFLYKYARVGAILRDKDYHEEELEQNLQFLIFRLENWTEKLRLPKLGQFGIKTSDVDRILKETENKNNPVSLTKEEMREILLPRI